MVESSSSFIDSGSLFLIHRQWNPLPHSQTVEPSSSFIDGRTLFLIAHVFCYCLIMLSSLSCVFLLLFILLKSPSCLIIATLSSCFHRFPVSFLLPLHLVFILHWFCSPSSVLFPNSCFPGFRLVPQAAVNNRFCFLCR